VRVFVAPLHLKWIQIFLLLLEIIPYVIHLLHEQILPKFFLFKIQRNSIANSMIFTKSSFVAWLYQLGKYFLLAKASLNTFILSWRIFLVYPIWKFEIRTMTFNKESDTFVTFWNSFAEFTYLFSFRS
jgi:hypothetical protein